MESMTGGPPATRQLAHLHDHPTLLAAHARQQHDVHPTHAQIVHRLVDAIPCVVRARLEREGLDVAPHSKAVPLERLLPPLAPRIAHVHDRCMLKTHVHVQLA